jgi:hypothetical protein
MRHPAARRPLDQVIQQDRLADSGVPAHNQSPALAGADRVEELVKGLALDEPAQQRRRAASLSGGPPSACHAR